MKGKAMLEVIAGVPLPGQYPGLKGIDLYGDGEVFTKGEKKKQKEVKHTGTETQRVTQKTGTTEYRSLLYPGFVESLLNDRDGFLEEFGDVVGEEGYDIITEVIAEHRKRFSIEPDRVESNLIQLCESVEGSPFSEKWYPVIKEKLDKTNVRRDIHRVVGDFVNANSEPLSERYPTTNVMLKSGEVDLLLKLGGVDKGVVKSAVSDMIDALGANTDFKSISKSPHQIVFTGMLMAATEMKDKQLIDDMITVVAFSVYPLIFRKYFPVTDPNKLAMEEALTLASKKFHIAKTKNLLEWVRKLTSVPYDFYKDKFEKGNRSDNLYFLFLNRVRNTMNQQFKTLYGVYKKAYDNKGISKLPDDEFITLGSNADKIQIYTMGVTNKITDMGFRQKVCDSAASFTKTPADSISKYVKEYIKDYKKYGLSELVQHVLTIYYNIGNQGDFLAVAIRQYPKIWTAKDKIYVEPRKYLQDLEEKFEEFDEEYLHRYTFGVYIYFCILINIALNNISNKLTELSLSQNLVAETKNGGKE